MNRRKRHQISRLRIRIAELGKDCSICLGPGSLECGSNCQFELDMSCENCKSFKSRKHCKACVEKSEFTLGEGSS